MYRTKLGLKLMAFVFVVGMILVGCGSTEAKGTNTPVSSQVGTENSTTDATEADYRIVSTTVAITEILAALDLDVVGIPTTVKQLPERYEGIVKVGNPMSPDMELIKSLKATHVLSVTTLQYDLEETFKSLGIDTSYLDLTSMDNMKAEITKLGELFDRKEQAQALIDQYDQKLSDIKGKIASEPAPNVLILMGIPGSYLVATEHSYIGDLVKQLGGVNVVTDSDVEFISSNTEYLHQSNPDIILRAAHGMPEEVIIMFDEEFKTNDIWKHFKAVQNDRVYDLPEVLFGTTGNLAADDALDMLATMLYPDQN